MKSREKDTSVGVCEWVVASIGCDAILLGMQFGLRVFATYDNPKESCLG